MDRASFGETMKIRTVHVLMVLVAILVGCDHGTKRVRALSRKGNRLLKNDCA